MVVKNFEIFLDIKRASDNEDFTVIEGDTGNYLHITLTDNGVPVDLTGCRVMAIFSKSNGTASQDSEIEDGGIEIGGEEHNEITIHLFQTSFADGVVECEIQVYSGDSNTTLITSAKFNFSCRRGILNDDTIASTNEYPLLVGLMGTVEKLQADVTAAETARAEAEAQRKAEDAARTAAETERAEAEESRVAAEELRADAEAGRQEVVDNAAAAADAANTAAAAANLAAQSADTAADRAEKAAEKAEGVVGGAVPSHAASHAIGGSDPITPASIGAQAVLGQTTVTLLASGWIDGAQSVEVGGVTADNAIVVSPSPESFLAYGSSQVWALEQYNGVVVFACEKAPEADLNVNILIVG